MLAYSIPFFFFFNDTATTEIYTLSLHDALPISIDPHPHRAEGVVAAPKHPLFRGWSKAYSRGRPRPPGSGRPDRKSTRLNSSHLVISYAVFCLKKKK